MSDSPRQTKPLEVLGPVAAARALGPEDGDLPRLLAILGELEQARARAAATERELLTRNGQLQDQLDQLLERQTDLVEHNRALRTELRETLKVQQELLRRHARRDAAEAGVPSDTQARYERETAMARTLIATLEKDCETKEARLAQVRDEAEALRNILRLVDPQAIDTARRKLAGR
jgi:hypothetical protein